MKFNSAALFASATLLAASAFAQSWPARPVQIVAPFSAGGAADTLGRLAAQKLSDAFKQPFVVQNRDGAGGLIGSELVARSAPDGYTLVVSSAGSHVIAPALSSKATFDPLKDFTHIALLGGIPSVLAISPSLPAKDLKEFIALAKSRPGQISYGSPGHGSFPHFLGELIKQVAGIDMQHVPYKGASGAVADLIGGHIGAISTTLATAAGQIKAGKARALAVSSENRLADYPDVPTFRELGYPDVVASLWFSLTSASDCATRASSRAISTRKLSPPSSPPRSSVGCPWPRPWARNPRGRNDRTCLSRFLWGNSFMGILILRPDDHKGLLSFGEGVKLVQSGFEDIARSPAKLSNPRTRTNTPEGFRMSVHQGVNPSQRGACTAGRGDRVQVLPDGKQKYIGRGRPVFSLFDTDTADLLMVMIGEPRARGYEDVFCLAGYQTACTAMVGTNLMARPDARAVGVLGAGGQAMMHLAALAETRSMSEVLVYSPTPAKREAFARDMQSRLNVSIDDETLRRAELVVTASWVQEELDEPEVLIGAMRRRVIEREKIRDISELINDTALIRGIHARRGITFFKNPGAWGIGIAALLRGFYERAREAGKGIDLGIEGQETIY
ncbi:MAG: hypothetical protein HYU75_07915 [Betaproteobacteria bacterium]|nr:hypothetical protein [Betaproteobacteria bacterium]